MHISQMFSLMHFDNFVQLCNHHPKQNIKHQIFFYFRKVFFNNVSQYSFPCIGLILQGQLSICSIFNICHFIINPFYLFSSLCFLKTYSFYLLLLLRHMLCLFGLMFLLVCLFLKFSFTVHSFLCSLTSYLSFSNSYL